MSSCYHVITWRMAMQGIASTSCTRVVHSLTMYINRRGCLSHSRPTTWTTWALAHLTMFSRGPPPRNNSISSRVSLHHPHEVACVLNIITEILAASAEIIRREEVYPIYWTRISLLTVIATLEREVMFTYRHVGYSICLLRISLGRD